MLPSPQVAPFSIGVAVLHDAVQPEQVATPYGHAVAPFPKIVPWSGPLSNFVARRLHDAVAAERTAWYVAMPLQVELQRVQVDIVNE